ncbi:hypothetical protein GM921_17345 [Pedobacter sp. LMG 31464]|uniref:TANFOR domain-containing protein n=1 Tax=Pedobacter planticolens TaxID=2679964 RepID=A0A923IVQ9_9SPHI|nr:hypothetical protein [Pedobacter planticolens]MBB2147270.1 hypothetical protein [Pedobacter planticolens]
MQNILSLIKDFKRVIQSLFLTFILALFSFNVVAQSVPAQVSVTVNILPPYSPYYSDYAGYNAGKVLLIVRNLTSTQKKIKLTGQLTGDNGVKISTKSTYVPLQPIILNPNETKQLNGTALKDIFDLNSLNVYGIDKVKLVQTSRIPEGNYDFCIQAVDMNSNQTVSDVAPVGCTKFNISYPNAPVLISPTAFSKISATMPQSVIFNWINPGNVPINTQYIIQLVAMPGTGGDPNQILNSTTFPQLNQRIIGTTYTYGPGNVPLRVGLRYAWRVIATDPTNKTGFMNDGKSQANVFIYGDDQQLAITNPDLVKPANLLNITNPLCKNSNETVFVGPNTNLTLNWLWKDQIESAQLFGNLDSNLLKHYTKVNVTPVAVNASSKSKANSDLKTPQVFETIKYYALNFTSQGGKSNAAKNIVLKVNAPLQSVSFTKEQADRIGLQTGLTYKLTIAAVSDKNTIITTVESCNWLLQQEIENPIPKLTVKGRLTYTLDKKNYFGVNKTTFSLQIVNKKDAKFNKNLLVFPKTGARLQPVAYATTDAQGNFTAQIEQLSTDTGKKYIAVVTSGAYYTMIGDNIPQNNVPVQIPKLNTTPNGLSAYSQEPLAIGDVKTDAYNFTLTINLSKGFNTSVNKNDFNQLYSENKQNDAASQYYAAYNITNVDTMSINPKAKVDAGMLVGIYRKAKKETVPTYEGDNLNPNPIFPLKASDIRVAEARTFIKDGKTVVVFSKLLLSVANDDEYYIKAILPKANPNDKTQGDSDADLVAPEQRLAFRPQTFNPMTSSYATTVNYQIISTKPPTAKIKGQIMEQWPSQPGVLHPYANKNFSVKMYTKDPTPPNVDIRTDNCQYLPAAVYQKIKDANGNDTWVQLKNVGAPEYTVAAGKTDANGKYEIEVLAFRETGNFDLEIRQESNDPYGPNCDEIAAAAADAEKKKLKEETTPLVVVNIPKSQQEIEKLIREQAEQAAGGDLGTENGSAGGEKFTFDIDGKLITTGSKLLEEHGGKGGDGNPFGGGGKIDPKLGVSANANLANGAVSGAAKAGKLGTQGLQKFLDDGIPTIITGPSNTDEEPIAYQPQFYAQQLQRYFAMVGIPKVVSTVNNDAGNTLEGFIVPPFGTVNLGVSIINVAEIGNLKVNVSVAGQSNNQALNGAKMVVFRMEKLPDLYKIVGEGSITHPMKPLISSTYIGDKENDMTYGTSSEYYKLRAGGVNVEWVLDQPLDIQPDNSFNLGNLRLSNDNNHIYYISITPPADGKSGRFKPYIAQLFKSGQSVQVQLATSRVSGRVFDGQTGKPIPNSVVRTEVYDVQMKTPISNTFTTDQNGYFEIINGANGVSWKDNYYFRAYAIIDGYANDDKPTTLNATEINALISPSNKDTTKVKPVQLFKDGNNYNFSILKKPGTLISGVVAGQIGNKLPTAIDAYIQTEDGTIIPTLKVDKDGKKVVGLYSFNATSKTQKFKIIPLDPGFIDSTYNVPVPKGTFTQNFILQRRMHKMIIKLQTADGQKIANGDVKVTINNDAALSKSSLDSQVSFEFENVSVNNYEVKVTNNNKNSYVPKLVNFKNDESATAQEYTITLEKGSAIRGKVTLDGLPAKNARVYLHYTTSDAVTSNIAVASKVSSFSGSVLGGSKPVNTSITADKTNNVASLEDFTDELGNYEIVGLPIKDNETVKVQVTMSADVAINGAEKDVQIIGGGAHADFALTTFKGPLVNNIYGFPLAVEKIEKITETQYSITGIVDLSTNSSSFTWANPDSKIRVSNVIVNAKDNYQPTGAVPIDAIANIKMRYLDKYNVLVKKYGLNVKSLNIEKTVDGGAIKGTVSIIDNSFKYPSSYLNFDNAGDFYLSIATQDALNMVNVPAIYSGRKRSEKYNLSNNAGGDLAFSFINFNTTANAKSSYIGPDGKFHLDINFKGEMPNSTPKQIDVNIKDLVLDGNTVEPQKGNSSLLLKLQTWDLEVKDWVIDVKKGGIYSENSIIKTGIIDVPTKLFNLRSDNVILDGFDVTNLYLGGDLVKLAGIKKENVKLVYDEAVGSDHSGHWRFSGASLTKDPVATIAVPAVAGKFKGLNLNVNYFQFISFANENLISLSSTQGSVKLYGNDKITFTPANIGSYVGKYAIGGSMKIDLPRVTPVTVDLMFDKTNMELGNFNLNFEGKGYVQFKNDQSKKVENNGGITKIYGIVEEPNKINPIPCDLTFSTTQPGIIALAKENNILNMDGVGAPDITKNLTLKIAGTGDDGMKEENKDWTTLKFSGELNDPNSDKLVTKKPFYKFEVLGDVTANANGISMEKATPFGSIQMIYDFPNRQMTGSLRMENIAFGSYFFTGDIEVSYGSKGFLMLGAGQLNTGTLFVEGFGTFNIGMLFANTTLSPTSIAKVTQYSKSVENKCWLDKYKTDFQGFFLTGGYDVLNEKKGIDLGVASVYLNAVLGVEASIGASFNKPSYKALIGAHGMVSAGMSAVTGTSINGSLAAHLTASAEYSNSTINIDGRAGIGVKYSLSQYLIAKTVTYNGSIDARVLFHYQPGATSLKFQIEKDNPLPDCPEN